MAATWRCNCNPARRWRILMVQLVWVQDLLVFRKLLLIIHRSIWEEARDKWEHLAQCALAATDSQGECDDHSGEAHYAGDHESDVVAAGPVASFSIVIIVAIAVPTVVSVVLFFSFVIVEESSQLAER